MRLKIYFTVCVLFFITLLQCQIYSQQLSSAVKQFVSINADTVALTHVRHRRHWDIISGHCRS